MSTGEVPAVGQQDDALGREFSLALIMFHQRVAEQAGLNLTDYKVLGLIPAEGRTAGEIAQITGLSTGMVTTVVDRLERKGFVYRDKVPADRRKVIIRADFAKVGEKLGPIFHSFGQAMAQVISAYSPEERRVIEDYIRKCTEVFKQEAAKWKQQ